MSDFGDAGEEFDAMATTIHRIRLVHLWRQAMVHQSVSTSSSADSTGVAATRHVEGGNVLRVCRFCVCGLSHAVVAPPVPQDGFPPYPVFLPCLMKDGADLLIIPPPLQRQTAPTGVAFSHTASSTAVQMQAALLFSLWQSDGFWLSGWHRWESRR